MEKPTINPAHNDLLVLLDVGSNGLREQGLDEVTIAAKTANAYAYSWKAINEYVLAQDAEWRQAETPYQRYGALFERFWGLYEEPVLSGVSLYGIACRWGLSDDQQLRDVLDAHSAIVAGVDKEISNVLSTMGTTAELSFPGDHLAEVALNYASSILLTWQVQGQSESLGRAEAQIGVWSLMERAAAVQSSWDNPK